MPRDLVQGTLDLLILKSLALRADHGLGISHRIGQITGGTFDVRPGSLFPALHRLEERGWLTSHWGESENRRRARYYALTPTGRRQLKTETRDWERVAAAMASALSARPDEA
jgi:transcriptional regulator